VRRLAIRRMRKTPQRAIMIPMFAKDYAQLPQWSTPTQLGYCMHSSAQGIELAPADGRTPWWSRTDGSVCDDGTEAVLEIWLDDRAPPAIIRLAGVLDQSTIRTLLSLVDGLFVKGVRHFLVDAGDLEIGDASGANELTVFQRRTREAGGSLHWEGLDVGQPRRFAALWSTPVAGNSSCTKTSSEPT
jgi:hypothetical protein